MIAETMGVDKKAINSKINILKNECFLCVCVGFITNELLLADIIVPLLEKYPKAVLRFSSN